MKRAGAPTLLPACVVAFGGCDYLFQLQQVHPVDASIDALASCEDLTPFGSSCRTVELLLTNDTYLSATAPDTPLGTRDAIRISSTDPALFKFDTTAIEPDERIARLTLTLDPYVSQNAKACSATADTCELCPAPGLGSWKLHWASPNWNQAEATWNHTAAPMIPWAAPGANGIPDDRSEVVASGPSGTSLLIADIPSADLLARSPNCYRNADSLAILVTLDGAAFFDSRERNACGATTESPPKLEVTLCR